MPSNDLDVKDKLSEYNVICMSIEINGKYHYTFVNIVSY